MFDDLVRAVAALLSFPVELDADMGYTGALIIDLGRRGGVDDPPDTASIDAAVQPVVWVFDVEGGRETMTSDFGPAADPREVARWISTEAQRAGSPAAFRAKRSTVAVSFSILCADALRVRGLLSGVGRSAMQATLR